MPTEEAEGTAGISPFYPADNKNHKTLPRDTSLVWRERLICQQMYCLWLRNAYVTDDSAEIWKQLFPTTMFCTWLEACDMLGMNRCIKVCPLWLVRKSSIQSPFPLSKPNSFLLRKMKLRYKALWNV